MSGDLKQQTFKGVIWSSIERFSTMGVGFAFGLVLARLLAPSDYGVIAMLGIFIAVAQCFIDSGFSTALVRKPDRTEIDNSTAFYFNIVVGLVFYALLYLAAPYIADFYDTPILIPVTRVVGLTLLFNSLCIVQQALLTIKLDFKTQANISLIALFISGPAGIACAWYGMGVWALVVQNVLSALLRTILLWLCARWRPQAGFSKASFKALFGFGSKLLASGLLDTTYNNIYTIVIGKKFNATSLGYYTRADHFVQMPSSNITGILQRVTFPVLCTIQNEDTRLAIAYRKFLRLSGFIIFPLMLGLAAVADPLVHLLLTDKWATCVPLLQVLCFALMWYPIHAINLNLLQVKGRSDLFLKLEIIKKIIGVITLCVTIPMGLFAMCAGKIVTSLICLAINTHYTGKLIGLGYWRQMADLCPTLLNSLATGAIAYGVQLCLPELWLKLLAATAAGGLYYLLSNALLRTMEWQEILQLLQRKQA